MSAAQPSTTAASPDTATDSRIATPAGAGRAASESTRRGRRDFHFLWGGQSIGLIGDQIFLFTLPLAAVTELNARTWQVTSLNTAAKISFLLIGLPAGVWVARLGLRRSMIGSDLVRGIAVLSVPLAALAGLLTLPHLLLVALVTGVATVFFQVAYQSYPPSLITDGHDLHGANTRLSLSESTSRMLGPSLAGNLVEALGSAARALFVSVGGYLLSVLTLLAIKHREPIRPPAARRNLWQEIGEGLRFVADHPVLKPIMVCGALYNLGFAMYESLLALFAIRHLHLTPGTLGWVIAIGGIGFPVGSLLARRLAQRVGIGPAIIISGVPSVIGLLVIALSYGRLTVPLLITGVLLNGVGQGSFAVNAITARHIVTSERMATRATSVHRFVTWGALPIGSATAGAVGEAFDLRVAMIVAAVTACTCMIPLTRSPLRQAGPLPRPAAQ